MLSSKIHEFAFFLSFPSSSVHFSVLHVEENNLNWIGLGRAMECVRIWMGIRKKGLYRMESRGGEGSRDTFLLCPRAATDLRPCRSTRLPLSSLYFSIFSFYSRLYLVPPDLTNAEKRCLGTNRMVLQYFFSMNKSICSLIF